MKLSFLLPLLLSLGTTAKAGTYIEPEKAFGLHLAMMGGGRYELRAEVMPGFALYRDKLVLTSREGKPMSVQLPLGSEHDDPAFGLVRVLTGSVRIPFSPSAPLSNQDAVLVVRYSGCLLDQFCYPPQTIKFDMGRR